MSNTVYGIIFREGYFKDNNYIITIHRNSKSDVATNYSFNSFSKPLVRKSVSSIDKAIEDIIRLKNDGDASRHLFKVAEFTVESDGTLTFVKSIEHRQPKCYRIKSVGNEHEFVSTYSTTRDKKIFNVCLTRRPELAISWTNLNTANKLLKQIKELHPELKLQVDGFWWGGKQD